MVRKDWDYYSIQTYIHTVCIALISGVRANILRDDNRRICCFLSSELLLSACFLNIFSFIANWRNAKQFLIGNEIETQFLSLSPSISIPLCKWAGSLCCPQPLETSFSHQFIVMYTVSNRYLSLPLDRRTSMAWATAAAQSVCHPSVAINGPRIRRPVWWDWRIMVTPASWMRCCSASAIQTYWPSTLCLINTRYVWNSI